MVKSLRVVKVSNWYNKIKSGSVFSRKAKEALLHNVPEAKKEIPTGYEVLAHPVMRYVESLNDVSNKLQTTDYILTEKDIESILNVGDKIFDTLEDRRDRYWVDMSEKYLEDSIDYLNIQPTDYQSAYIAYFFALKVLKTIEPIARYVVDITPPEDKFMLDENL